MAGHAVIPFANGLSGKLAARSRHVCAFLGAGAARACGLPDVTGLQTKVLKGLKGDQRATFEAQLAERNLEQALSRLRRIAVLLEGTGDRVDGLTADQALALDREVCRLIVAALDLTNADMAPMLRLAAWAARADYHLPVELFTVNYDLLLESALEAIGVPYFDGFIGALRARFRTELVEAATAKSDESLPAFLVRLWKLHGSVNWAWESGARSEVVRLGAPVADNQPAAIYPSDAKYDESRRVPFVVLQDRLRRALNHPETLMLISGYAFGDAHLNEMLFDAARRRPRSELIAFCFGSIPDELAERAATTPNLQAVNATEAILGGVRASWETPDEAPTDLWTTDGFAMGDFANLAGFLARSSPPQGELEARLGELLAKAAADASA
jgi:SIR2-like domain